MGRAPCCDKANVKKGPWSPEEDDLLKDYIHKNGTGGNWISLPHRAGLKRCGKSCRLRWLNYLRPNIKHGEFSDEEDMIICTLFSSIGSRWSIIAAQLPGRTDNDIKNYWNTKLKKKLISTMSSINTKPPLISPYKIISNSSSPGSQYNSTGSNYYNAPCSNNLSFTAFNQSTTLSGISSNSLRASATQSSYPVIGGAPEPSCSSSEVTNSGEQVISFHNSGYFYSGSSSMEEDNKPQITSDPLIWEETAPLIDYGLEEIKQLISTTTAGSSFYY